MMTKEIMRFRKWRGHNGMNWLKRAIRNWLGVNGDSSYPHRFVAFVTWQGMLIGVDGNGDFYEIGLAQERHPGETSFTLMQRNPLER